MGRTKFFTTFGSSSYRLIFKRLSSFDSKCFFSVKERTGISWEGLPDYMLSTNRRYNVTGLYYDDFGNEAFYDMKLIIIGKIIIRFHMEVF
jgi:hypothetical protein